MRLLLDANVWYPAKPELQAAGHDVMAVEDIQPSMPDPEVLHLANAEGRILITLDKDFGRLAVKHKLPHRGIIQMRRIPARAQARTVIEMLMLYADRLTLGAIVTVTGSRKRIRPPEPR